MDEKQIELAQKLYDDGVSINSIVKRLNFTNPSETPITLAQLESVIKKKTNQTDSLIIGGMPQIGQSGQPIGGGELDGLGSGSEEDQSESLSPPKDPRGPHTIPFYSEQGPTEGTSFSGKNTLGKRETLISAQESQIKAMRLEDKEDRTPLEEIELNQLKSNSYWTGGGSNKGRALFDKMPTYYELAGTAYRMADDLSLSYIDREVNKDPEFQKDFERVNRTYVVGGTVNKVNTSALYYGGSGQGSMKSVTVTPEMREEEISKIRASAASRAAQKFVNEKILPSVMDGVPDDLKQDKEFLRDLSDYILNQSGVRLDLDGDGAYNEFDTGSGVLDFVLEAGNAFNTSFSSLAQGVMDAPMVLLSELTGDGKEFAERRVEQQELSSRRSIQHKMNISESFASGDIGGAVWQMGTGTFSVLPSIGVALTPYGALTLGVSGFGNNYVEARANPEFSVGGRWSYAATGGLLEFAGGKLTDRIFKSSVKNAFLRSQRARASQVLAGRKYTFESLGAYAYNTGIAMNKEGLEEVGQSIGNDFARAMGTGKEYEFNIKNYMDDYILGMIGGKFTTGLGTIKGNSNIMARARADRFNQEAVRLEQEAQKLEEQAMSSPQGSQSALITEAESNRKRAKEIRSARSAFYDMVGVRRPDLIEAYQRLDVEIEALAIQLESESTSAEAKEILEKKMLEKTADRIKLDDLVRGESMDLTDNERAQIFESSARNQLKKLTEDLEIAEMNLNELMDLYDFGEATSEQVKVAADNADAMRKAQSELEALMSDFESIKKAMEETNAEEDSEAYEALSDEALEVVQRVGDITGLSLEAFGQMTAGQYLNIQSEINARYTGQWTSDAINDLDNTNLTRAEIEAILRSENFGMLTAENPNAKAVDNRRNRRYNRRAEKWLIKKGYKYHKIVGRYGAGENSFLVEGLTRADAAEFAKSFGQESVAHKDGLVQADGSINTFDGEGPSFFDSTDGDFFSAIKDSEGNVVAFGFNPSSEYQDADGNSITEQEYSERGANAAITLEDLEASMSNEGALGPDVEGRTESENEGGYTVVRKTSDGSHMATVGNNGIQTTAEAQVINNLGNLMNKIFPKGNFEIRLYEDQDLAAEVNNSRWGGLKTRENGKTIIHINPTQIRLNALQESSMGLRKTKTFEETVQEEVMHAVLGSSFKALYKNKLLASSLRSLVFSIAKNGPAGLAQRMEVKEKTYRDDLGQSGAQLFEETMIEFLSAFASDPDSFNLKGINKVRLALNKGLVALYGAAGKKFKIADIDQLIAIGNKFSEAQRNGDTEYISFADLEPTSDDESAQSAAISPAALKPGEDGKLRVKMQETFYKYDIGFKKDIGSDEIVKTFNDKWHFINWWKKATKMGENQHFFSFRTEDGQEIDVDRIKDYNTNYSTQLSAPSEVIPDMLNKAARQGIISRVVSSRAKRRMQNKLARMEQLKKRGKEDSQEYKKLEGALYSYKEYIENFLQDAAKRAGKTFVYDERSEDQRASAALSEYYLAQVGLSEYGRNMDDFFSIKGHIKALTGENVEDRVSAHEVMRNYFMSEATFVDPFQRLKIIGASYLGADGKERIAKYFGGRNPINFFTDYDKEAYERIDTLISEGRLSGDRKDLKMKLNFIMAFVSAQNKAVPNTAAAFNILELSEKGKDTRGPNEIVSKEIIKALEDPDNYQVEGFDISKVPGHTRKNAAIQFRKLNALLEGKPIRLKSAAAKRQVERFISAYGPLVSAEGVIQWENLMTLMLEPYGYGDKRIRKGKKTAGKKWAQENFGELFPESPQFMGQEIFADKLGAWAMNLSQHDFANLEVDSGMRDRKNKPIKTRLSDVVTIDTHLMNTMALVMGKPFDAKAISHRNIIKIFKELGKPLTGADITHLRQGIHELRSDIVYRMKAGFDSEKLKRLRRDAVNPSPELNAVEKRAAAAMIMQMAQELEVTPSQLGQILFADRQIVNWKYLTSSDAIPNSPVLDKADSLDKLYRGEYETYGKSIANMNIENSLSEADADSEVAASAQLTLPIEDSQDAFDSPLYRSRQPEEALSIRGVQIDDDVVMEALSTDATSRRIMAKDSQVSEGQKVGIRLNLNVMKNTGIPVQTMHDKTASGEALKYAAAVMVKNPTLFVNQNARRKIVTFQENKFPMASVNGEFLSDNLSQMNFDGVKAFFNPFKHNVFVDASGRPIKSAEEATIVGNTVYLRGNIEYYDFTDPILFEGRNESPENREKRVKRGPKYDKSISRFEAFSKRNGVEFSSREELEEAYDNMPLNSIVALNNSEVAANMEQAQTMASAQLKIRQTAGRSARFYQGDTRKKILDNPNNYFTPQVIKKLKQDLAVKSDSELIDIMSDDGLGRLSQRNDDLGVLAAGELITRAIARGDMDAVPDLIEEAAAMGTTAGRILRHLRELKGSTPKGIEMIILKAVERKGNTLSDEQKNRLKKMAADMFRLGSEHEALMKRAIAGEDVEAELKAKTKELKEAERALETFANATIERGWGEIGGLLIQGNLLTPMSQITNVGANMVNALGKVAVDAIALPIERMVNMFGIESPMKRNYSINAYIHGMRRFGAGFMEALDQIYTGQEADVTEWRMTRGFAPFRSLMSAMGKGDLPLGPDGKTNLNTRAKLFVQGTLGIPAEVMFRFLSLGDTPFRRYVEGIELYQMGRNQGLEGDALKNFLKYPTKVAREAAEAEGKKLTYQEETIASRTADDFVKFVERMTARFFDWIPGTDGTAIARFLIRSNIPYRRTPANILYDTLTFATPYVAVPRMMAELKNGDARSASQTLAKSMIGGMATQVTLMMIREGLISGAIEWNEDEEKNIAYDQFPPNSINVSALKRWVTGGSPAKQEDDEFISYMKLGILGTVMGSVVKGVDREELKKRDYSGDKWVTHVIQDSFGIQAFSSIAHMMDQSFVQGMNNLIQVISTGDERTWENWLGTTFQAMSATVLPNTLSAFYRAERDYLPDTRITKDMSFTERILKKFEYTIKSRTFGLGELPIRRNWKGEKIEQTPRGTNGIAYQLFDITKARQGEADAVSNEIWRLYEQTEDLTKVCGTPGYAEKRKLNVPNVRDKHRKMLEEEGLNYTWVNDDEFMADRLYLNTTHINRLMEASGKERYAEVEAFMETEEYNAMDDEAKVEALNDINDNYNSAIEIHDGKFRNHTKVLFEIMQEIYESER